MPEAPKQGFLKGLFGGGPKPLDREELFGEASGKASTSLAKSIPGAAGMAALQVSCCTAVGQLVEQLNVAASRDCRPLFFFLINRTHLDT